MTTPATPSTSKLDLPVLDAQVKQPPYSSADWGLSLLRIVLCGIFVYHGIPKLLNLTATAAFMESQHIPLPWFSALAAGLAETVGGALILVGLGTRYAAAIVVVTMLVACSVHWPVFDNRNHGFEYPLTLAGVAAALALIGPGRLSYDGCKFGDAGGPKTYITK